MKYSNHGEPTAAVFAVELMECRRSRHTVRATFSPPAEQDDFATQRLHLEWWRVQPVLQIERRRSDPQPVIPTAEVSGYDWQMDGQEQGSNAGKQESHQI